MIHIQDAHCNYYAQKKIVEILDYLNKTYGIDTINLEGASRDYDLSVFTDIKDIAKREKVADYFLKEGIINGAEYWAINSGARGHGPGVSSSVIAIRADLSAEAKGESALAKAEGEAKQSINDRVAILDTYRKQMARFYEYSLERDEAFLRNAKYSKRGSILITGGFHSENLAKLFKKRGIAYISIMPNFKNTDGYECPYFKVLSGEKYKRLCDLGTDRASLSAFTINGGSSTDRVLPGARDGAMILADRLATGQDIAEHMDTRLARSATETQSFSSIARHTAYETLWNLLHEGKLYNARNNDVIDMQVSSAGGMRDLVSAAVHYSGDKEALEIFKSELAKAMIPTLANRYTYYARAEEMPDKLQLSLRQWLIIEGDRYFEVELEDSRNFKTVHVANAFEHGKFIARKTLSAIR